MTPAEEARIRAAARKAAAELPPPTAETARKVAAIVASAIRELDEREAALPRRNTRAETARADGGH